MENKINILKEMGHDITGIINGCNHPAVIANFYKYNKNKDIVLKKWTEESILEFSEKIYNIVTKWESKK